jgi:glycosyltransferase involved in cell wall biosynthesis
MLELSRELKSLGFSIFYVLPKVSNNRYGEKQADNEDILKKYGKILYTPLRKKLYFILGDLFFLKKFFIKNNPDIVISYTEYAGKLCRILYKKSVIKKLFHVPSCVGVIRKRGFNRFIEKFFEKRLSKFASAYLACGASESFVLNSIYKIPKEKIIFLPNLRSINNFKNNKKKYKYKFIYVGRMVREKGVFELIYSLSLLGFLGESLFVGEGRDLDKLKSMYPDANFLGRVEPEEVLRLFSFSQFFVSNSIIEGLPYSLIEAMACGAVPIVSNVDGHKDLIIDGKNGFLYNKRIDLANCLFKAKILPQEDYIRMSTSACNTILNLNKLAKKNIRNNFKIYE